MTYSTERPGRNRRLNSPKGCKTNALFPRLIAIDEVESELELMVEVEVEDRDILLLNELLLLSVTRLMCCRCESEPLQKFWLIWLVVRLSCELDIDSLSFSTSDSDGNVNILRSETGLWLRADNWSLLSARDFNDVINPLDSSLIFSSKFTRLSMRVVFNENSIWYIW